VKNFWRYLFITILLVTVFTVTSKAVEVEIICGKHPYKGKTYANLDTGMRYYLPNKAWLDNKNFDVSGWKNNVNIDVTVKVMDKMCLLSSNNSFFHPVENKVWDKTGNAALDNADKLAGKGPWDTDTIAVKYKDLPRTFVFKTDEGATGVLQIYDYDEIFEDVKLRYRIERKEENSKFQINVTDEADRKEIEALIAGIRHSIQPAKNMRVIFADDHVKRTDQDAKHTVYTYTFSGNRSRLDVLYNNSYYINEEKFLKSKKTAVYDGIGFRQYSTDHKGRHFNPVKGFVDLNQITLFGSPFAHSFNFYDQNSYIYKSCTFELSDSDQPNIAILNVITESPSKQQIYIDTERGFNIVKIETILTNSSNKITFQCQLKQHPNGIWYTRQWKMTKYLSDYTSMRKAYVRLYPEVIDVQFDIDIDEDDFKLEFPADIEIDAVTRAT